MTYEKVGERQNRLIKAIAASMGASYENSDEPVPLGNLDQGPQVLSKEGAESHKKDQKLSYETGEITAGKSTVFGYQQVDNLD